MGWQVEERRGQNTRKDISAYQVAFRQNTAGGRCRSGLGLSEGKVTRIGMNGSSFSVCFCHEDGIWILPTHVNEIIAKIKPVGQLFPKSGSEGLETEAVVQVHLCEATSSCLAFGFTRLLAFFFFLVVLEIFCFPV